MLLLLLGFSLLFVGGHFLLSALPVRTRLVAVLGEKGFLAGYSLISLLAFVGMVWAYNRAPYVNLWGTPLWTRWLSLLLLLPAFMLAVAGVTTKNPTAVGQESAAGDENVAVGIVRVTRHPLMWGVALWGIAHLLANGDVASLLFFGSLVLLALAGTVHIDRRLRVLAGADYERYRARTSHLPFAAIVTGKQQLVFSEIGHARMLAGMALYAAFLVAHGELFGVMPLGG